MSFELVIKKIITLNILKSHNFYRYFLLSKALNNYVSHNVFNGYILLLVSTVICGKNNNANGFENHPQI